MDKSVSGWVGKVEEERNLRKREILSMGRRETKLATGRREKRKRNDLNNLISVNAQIKYFEKLKYIHLAPPMYSHFCS